MKKQDLTLVKLGGNVITRKHDNDRIHEYLTSIESFMDSSANLSDLQTTIFNLLDLQQANKIFTTIRGHLRQTPHEKIILLHGAGSIGHPLVATLAEDVKTLQEISPVIKLAVGIQNQILVATGIQAGLPTVSITSHQILRGDPTTEKAAKKVTAPNLDVLEDLISNTNVIPMFFGDMGYTHDGWRVFSGDIIPSALMDRISGLNLTRAIFITQVSGKKVGIYTKDPFLNGAKYINRIEVFPDRYLCYGEKNALLEFESGETSGGHDVTGAMQGKLENIVQLARGYVDCVVTGVEDFPYVLNNSRSVGTRILSKNKPHGNLVFLGTGDAFAAAGFKSAGIFLEFQHKGILLDCGPHALQALKATGRSTDDLDMILITHFHGDHLAGMPFLLLELMYLHPSRTKPLTILGPPLLKNRISELFHLFYGNIPKIELPHPCYYVEITHKKPFASNGIQIIPIAMAHTPEAQGYRIETPFMKLAYSGDTGWTDNLIELVRNTDLAVVECNFFRRELAGVHLNYFQAKKLTEYTKRLVLTHLGDETREYVVEIHRMSPDIIIPLEGQEIKI
ncbi:MAG: MBL fold metallo-hydrolase [Candidatus Thorarchaeota archaeon]